MKQCRYCKKKYPEKDFGVALTTKNKVYRRHKCRDCYRETKNDLKKSRRDFLWKIKKDSKCAMCGCDDYRVLDFHHSNHKDKEFSISNVLREGQSLERIKKEISKCVIICANCHRIVHHKERNGA